MLLLICCCPCLSHQQAFTLPVAPSMLPGEVDCSPHWQQWCQVNEPSLTGGKNVRNMAPTEMYSTQ